MDQQMMNQVDDLGMEDMLINQESYGEQQITIQVHSKTGSPELEDTNEEVSQKIS